MKDQAIYFVSNNEHKYEELLPLFKDSGIDIKFYKFKIEEMQSDDIEKIVYSKAIQAFKQVRRPVIVDHTGLFIKSWNEMPGALTQMFWDALQEKICTMVDCFDDRTAVAKTVFGYCDGREVFSEFSGESNGIISETPKIGREFQWAKIFVPEGCATGKAYSEISIDELNKFSYRAIAFNKFCSFYKKHRENL